MVGHVVGDESASEKYTLQGLVVDPFVSHLATLLLLQVDDPAWCEQLERVGVS